MSSGRGVEMLFYALLLVLPVAALVARRPPLRRIVVLILIWIAIFAIGLLAVSQRDRIGELWRDQTVEGRETRIRMANDGHFWADVDINGISRRMLIDSGATTTAISQATARAASLEDDSPFPVVLNTANGQITARTATANRISLGGIAIRDVPVGHVASVWRHRRDRHEHPVASRILARRRSHAGAHPFTKAVMSFT